MVSGIGGFGWVGAPKGSRQRTHIHMNREADHV